MLTARGLTKSYFRAGREQGRTFDAVSHVSLEINPGELVALQGRSGSGKTTLLSMLGGLLKPDSGEVLLEDTSLYMLADEELSRLRNEHIGVIPQGQTPLFDLTVRENVELPFAIYHPGEHVETRSLDLLDKLGIADLSESYPSELSGGELRRMAIARALICEPKLVLADEPTGDLDDESTRMVLELLSAYARSGAAVLVVTHEAEVNSWASRVLRMDAGKLI